MSALGDLTTGPKGIVGLIDRLSRRFSDVPRRDFFVGAAVAGSAMAVAPKAYALEPVTAYATVCGPGNTRAQGWTALCCTINKGVNACPPGSFAAGWWKASSSSWCGTGARYIVDCNATCKCDCGSGTHLCSRGCWSCSCYQASGTCDQRRVCCNAFRYGQCNTHIGCSGGVYCRVMSCVPPYRWANCTTTVLVDNATAEHSAPCIAGWGPITKAYVASGAEGSWYGGSTGPIRSVGDGRGSFVNYQNGTIYHTAATGARGMTKAMNAAFLAAGGPRKLGYPNASRSTGLQSGGMIQPLEKGWLVDSNVTAAVVLQEPQIGYWKSNGREGGPLGYPTANLHATGGWLRGWVQHFQNGAIASSAKGGAHVVLGQIYLGWKNAGFDTGVLAYPTGNLVVSARGRSQAFTHGEIWALGGGVGRRVYGGVLDAWKKAGGATGSYGYPTTDTTADANGQLRCTFEHGTITSAV